MAYQDFNPQVVGGNDSLTPPSIVPPEFVDSYDFTITDGDTTIILDAPDWNNQISTKYEQFSTETAGGDLILLRSQAEIIDRRIVVVFENISQAQKDALMVFLKTNLGKRITVSDHEGVQWSVYCLNPTEAFTQEIECKWSGRLEFEGDIIPQE